MDYKKVIEIVKDLDCRGYTTYRQARQLAIEACEKQISKTPVVWENKYYMSPTPNDDWGYECPCCGNREIDYPDHHCICGQALSWDDIDI